MRVGVIRGDLPGPVFIADLEPTSQINFSVDPAGQTRYLSRPNLAAITAYLASQSLVATATALVTATVPVGGPVNVASATIKAVGSLSGATVTQVTALQDLLAPRFHETDCVVKSFVIGNLHDLRSANFTPDSSRLPTITPGAAIGVVQDDGSTAFTAAALGGLPIITGAAVGGGNLTITGTGLGNSEVNEVKVKVTNPATGATYSAVQRKFVAAGGSVSSTSVVIPVAQLGTPVAGWLVQLRFTSFASNVFTAT